MKKRSLLAIFSAVTMLAGCSAGKETASEASLSMAESAENGVSARSDGSTDTSAAGTVSSVVSSTAATEAAVVSGEYSGGTESSRDIGISASHADSPSDGSDISERSGEPADGSLSSVAEMSEMTKSSDSVADDGEYKGKDIGGSDKSFGGDLAGDIEVSGFADIIAEADMDFGAAELSPSDSSYGCDIIIDDSIYYPEAAAGLLTGGEWNDNEHWDFWQSLYSSPNYNVDWSGYAREWRFGADHRLAVTVEDGHGQLISGAKVSFEDSVSVTDNKGMAYFFFSDELQHGEYTLTTEYNGYTHTEQAELNGADTEMTVTLEMTAEKQSTKSLDLMIMCDTTGSMGDELNYLKAELEDVVTRIRQENANIPTRISVNFYRDDGDEYVVREFPFTTDLNAAVGAIAEQKSDGGGDYPEAVHKAMESAVSGHDWAEDSVKVMFLVLDAPPHDDVQTIDEVVKYTRMAAEKGIRIVPVAASGIDKSTEYLLRTMAFVTNGTYVFLTDDSGIGGSHIEPTIGSYDVEKLNDMMVRIVGEYIQ